MAVAQEAENHGNQRGLTWYFWWGIYTSIPVYNHSQNAAVVQKAQRHHPMKHLLDNHENLSNEHENDQSLCNEKEKLLLTL